MSIYKNFIGILLAAVIITASGRYAEAEQFIVKDGKTEAEIVISKTPQRTTMLAARELQRAVKKISCGKLPIVREPSGDVSVTIYVGESPYTDNKIFIFENYPMGANYLPFYTPHIIADTINQTKGYSRGKISGSTPFTAKGQNPDIFIFRFTSQCVCTGVTKTRMYIQCLKNTTVCFTDQLKRK